MRNPFAKLQTPGQWLLGSVCWAVSCVGGWLMLNAVVLQAPYNQRTPGGPLFFLGFAIAHILLWRKALPGLSAVAIGASWLGTIAFLWQVLLLAFQLIWLGVTLILLAANLFHDSSFNLLKQ
jgi:hypothetical protein